MWNVITPDQEIQGHTARWWVNTKLWHGIYRLYVSKSLHNEDEKFSQSIQGYIYMMAMLDSL